MRKLILVVHTSLDGFVAGLKGELDGFQPAEENLAFVCKLTESADAALCGRISYELLNAHWPQAKDRSGATVGEVAYSKWYNSAKKIVLSRTLKQADGNTIILSKDVRGEVLKIKQQPGKDILIFGSPASAQSIWELIDSYWVFVNPVIFGVGIPMFGEQPQRLGLGLVESKVFGNGEIALHYVRL